MEVVELDLERPQGVGERSGVGCDRKGRRKKKSLNRVQEIFCYEDVAQSGLRVFEK